MAAFKSVIGSYYQKRKRTMINIIKKSNDQYVVNVNDTNTMPLSVDELFKVMRSLEVDFEEIELAIVDLVRNDFKRAHFGINRTYIFSK